MWRRRLLLVSSTMPSERLKVLPQRDTLDSTVGIRVKTVAGYSLQ